MIRKSFKNVLTKTSYLNEVDLVDMQQLIKMRTNLSRTFHSYSLFKFRAKYQHEVSDSGWNNPEKSVNACKYAAIRHKTANGKEFCEIESSHSVSFEMEKSSTAKARKLHSDRAFFFTPFLMIELLNEINQWTLYSISISSSASSCLCFFYFVLCFLLCFHYPLSHLPCVWNIRAVNLTKEKYTWDAYIVCVTRLIKIDWKLLIKMRFICGIWKRVCCNVYMANPIRRLIVLVYHKKASGSNVKFHLVITTEFHIQWLSMDRHVLTK